MTKLATVESKLNTVTAAQIGACSKVPSTSGNFYTVASATTTGKEYTVKAVRKNGVYFIVCDCEAGKNGLLCWHKRAAVAASKEEKAAMAELAMATAQEALNECKPAAPALTPVSEWTAKERRDWKLNESRNNAIDELVRSLEMARDPGKRWG